jgi:sporulation protein YlmC with PRC-barrel domain/ribosomal protein L37AE/L43A
MVGGQYGRLIGLKAYDLAARLVGVVEDIGFKSDNNRIEIYLVLKSKGKELGIPIDAVKAVADIILLKEGYEELVSEAPQERLGAPPTSIVEHRGATQVGRDEAEDGKPSYSLAGNIVIPRCPKCGSAVVFDPKRKEWYCHHCRSFVKLDPRVAARAPRCPTCNLPLSFIEQYKKWYCYNCKRYVEV